MNLELRIRNYITRYAPSRKRLTEYLQKKGVGSPEDYIDHIQYSEDMVIRLWIQTWIAFGKGKVQMERKLKEKGFSKESIRKGLSQYEATFIDWSVYEPKILEQIESFRQKKKSLQHIEILLRQRYPYFSHEIHDKISALDDTNSLQSEVQKYKNRYNIQDIHEKQKLYNALMRKGFRYKDIKDTISSITQQ